MRNKGIWLISGCLMVLILVLSACVSPAATTQAPTTSAPVVTSQAPTSSAPATTAAGPAKPQGELIVGVTNFGNEEFLPWLAGMGSSEICDFVYDMLIYWNDVDRKFIPGLAESWEVSPDALTTTFHLRKGVQFQNDWGEFTSADLKFNFEGQASKYSVGKVSQTRNIASMDTPDPYTLIVNLKTPKPTFFMEFCVGNSGVCQGIACKKYVESVGEEVASQKPIGSGPFKLVESRLGDYYKFEALDSHWRVIPEFKSLTLRAAPEVSTAIAMLKTKEIDLANVPAEQLAGLRAAGLATEVTPYGGSILAVSLGGMSIPEDKRYDSAYHNKDPWMDPRVRKALALAIDRQAICNAIYAGAAFPVGVPLFGANMDTYKIPYDPAAAKQLLKDAGYPNGFSFKAVSYSPPGVTETPRVMEALVGFWQQIGLDPKITIIDYAVYTKNNLHTLKTAGDLYLLRISPGADVLGRVELSFMPGSIGALFMDAGSYAIWKEGIAKVSADERQAYVDKLNQYYYENSGPIPILRAGFCFAWNSDKIQAWPHSALSTPYNIEYIRHAQPLNTFRLFTIMPGR